MDALADLTFVGPPADDEAVLARVPVALAALLRKTNGFVAFGGGLHLRGACREPAWHSLAAAWEGPDALHRLFDEVEPEDVPFAEDAMGDQFLLRRGTVHALRAETGDIESMDADLAGFLSAACEDPACYLEMEPLLRFRREGGRLEPGQLLSAYPPFALAVSGNASVSLRAIPARDRMGFLADFARQIRRLSDGAQVTLRIGPEPGGKG